MKSMEAVLLYPSVYGILVFNDAQKIIGHEFSTLAIKDLAQKYHAIQKGEIPPKLREFLKKLQSEGEKSFLTEDQYLLKALQKETNLHVRLTDDMQILKTIQSNLIQHLVEAKISFSARNLTERSKILAEFLIRTQIAESATQGDFLIKQAIDTIVDIDKSINFFSSRLREWYGLHFPELTDKLVGDNRQFAEYVLKIGQRQQFQKEELLKYLGIPEDKARMLEEKATRSMGGNLSDLDFLNIRNLAAQIIGLHEYRQSLEAYVDKTLENVAPNLNAVLGSQITGKLISIAGSLERLAKFSSSTIQILGAEKALFKALKAGSDTPKYGILFQWNKIRGEKGYLRGKIARMAAGKVSILAKVDYYKGTFIGDQYKAEIERKIELIKKQ
ncbi:MAG: hypothetical protein KAR20_17785, partial [Candidatus Heimdallarchaeota archaeon]|nr:hypothetical protein [Candidatus Heimdallarchaeota archaeon]